MKIYPRQSDVHTELKRLRDESQLFLSSEDLKQLDTYAKRIRGEILFARAWLLCEGQCEYLLLRYFAELRHKPLDHNGVAVIDFQNNGSPGAFVGLARAFGIPWIMLCDNDDETEKFMRQVRNCGLTEEECNTLVRPLPGKGVNLEKYLVSNGFADEYSQILQEQGVRLTTKKGEMGFEDEIVSRISAHKPGYATQLIEKLRAVEAEESRVPQFLSTAIDDIVAKVLT
jgi:putative ATP-dependent endonuclease of OLD family